jgi:hypothetical protein
MNGYEYLVSDDMFQERFLTRSTTILVFEQRDGGQGWGLNNYGSGDKKIFEYLKSQYNIDRKDIQKSQPNDFVTCYSFLYNGYLMELFHLNAFYIPVYKPFLKPIIVSSNKSLFMEGMWERVDTFSCDLLVVNYFNYYFHCSRGQKMSWTDSRSTQRFDFLVNIDEMKKPGNEDIRMDLESISDVTAKDVPYKELKQKSEDPRYKKVIQFVGQPDLWTILEDESVASTSSSGTASSSGTSGGGLRKKTRRKVPRRTRKKIIGRRTSRKH